MREILFRGKRIDNGEWVEGYVGIFKGETQIYVPFTAEEEKENEGHIFSVIGGLWHTIDPFTVGQFTGLTDKNGKKIFEGDIVKTVTFSFDCDKFITEVKFGARSGVQGFYLANGRSMFYFGQKNITVMEDTEVIGNIHDNPELLENP